MVHVPANVGDRFSMLSPMWDIYKFKCYSVLSFLKAMDYTKVE